MRQLYFLLLISFIYTSCKDSSVTVKLENPEDVRGVLSNEWEAVYMETTGSRIKVPEEQVTNVVFNKNGTFTSKLKNGVITTNGEWSYDPKTQILYMGKGKEKGPGRIEKLTENEFILVGYILSNDIISDSIVFTYKKI